VAKFVSRKGHQLSEAIGIKKRKEGIGRFSVWAINMDIEISRNY
jgi:hypothetical protein